LAATALSAFASFLHQNVFALKHELIPLGRLTALPHGEDASFASARNEKAPHDGEALEMENPALGRVWWIRI